MVRTVKEDETELAVMDNGPGIPADALPRIFEKFVSLGGTSSADGSHGRALDLRSPKALRKRMEESSRHRVRWLTDTERASSCVFHVRERSHDQQDPRFDRG